MRNGKGKRKNNKRITIQKQKKIRPKEKQMNKRKQRNSRGNPCRTNPFRSRNGSIVNTEVENGNSFKKLRMRQQGI